jgi:S1-C subfamily serine protease
MAARVRKGLDREKIAAATVRFLRRGGQGALVPGRMILTAAHVIQRRDWIVDEHHIEEVEIGGRRFKAEVVAVEPLSDIALVGAPDAQSSAEALAFEEHLDSIRPVLLCTAEFPLMEKFQVFIRSHQLRWIEGQARQVSLSDGTLFIDASAGIVGGTSGGPVVTADGLLLSVISTAGGEAGKPMREAIVRRPHLMAPGWLARRMLDPGRELREMRRHIRKNETRATP